MARALNFFVLPRLGYFTQYLGAVQDSKIKHVYKKIPGPRVFCRIIVLYKVKTIDLETVQNNVVCLIRQNKKTLLFHKLFPVFINECINLTVWD